MVIQVIYKTATNCGLIILIDMQQGGSIFRMMMTKYGLVSHFQLNNVADDMIDKDFEIQMESIEERVSLILRRIYRSYASFKINRFPTKITSRFMVFPSKNLG